MSLIKKILENSKSEKRFIGIWIRNDDDGFWSGFVQDYNNEYVYIKHFSKYGKPDGIVVEKIDQIESIDFDDTYSQCMQYLIENTIELDFEEEITLPLPDDENWQYLTLKEQLKNKERIVRIEINEEEFFSGFVEAIDTRHVTIHRIGNLGEDENFSLFNLDDITTVRINDLENRKKHQ